ncbi:Uncharacterised protein [Vibrio cholerae]|uniref:Uncharacterized protein n=1 Tax=Vibrio cholerae TaxID=666 RepID=A0A656AR01_VIBCL|nr:Uncharacterised protein [Vibrio cholerae]CSD28173.1 Uncharacterised protein [Vibrio cholerae]
MVSRLTGVFITLHQFKVIVLLHLALLLVQVGQGVVKTKTESQQYRD